MTGPDRTRPPPPGRARPVRLPPFREQRLSSGLRLYVAERRSLPEVSLRLIVEGGAAGDPPLRAGAAELAGRLLTEGAGERSAPQMAEWLDRLGAGFSVSVGYDTALLSAHTLSDVLEGTLDFAAEAALRPRFEPSEVERVRQERLDEIEREREEPPSLANHLLAAAVYGADHPYGRPAGGVRETVEGLDAEAVRSFHRNRYGAAGAALVAFGDVDARSLAQAVEDRFAGWSEGAGPVPPPPAPLAPLAAGRVWVVDRPGSPQSEIRVGAIGASRRAEDYFEAIVANAILGGLFNSRLNMRLREEKGWTYGARSAFSHRRGAGPFVAAAAVETGVTAPALEEMLSEIEGLGSRPPDEGEMRLACNALTLSLPRQFETVSQVTRRLVTRIVYGLEPDYWERFRERVEAVTADQVVAVARRYLRREQLVLVAVGDAERIAAPLERLGPVELRPAP